MAKKKKPRPAASGTPAVVVSDSLEIMTGYGMVCLRTRDQRGGKAIVAVPAEMYGGMHKNLHLAAMEAEEGFWDVMQHFDPQKDYPAFETWLMGQEWSQLAAKVTAPGPLLLLTHAGHVGLVAIPPYSDRRLIVVFSPAQLHRTRAGRVAAGAEALTQAADPVVRSMGERRAALALGMLRERPWPGDDEGFPDPEDAKATMVEMYRNFLRRDARGVRNPIPD